MISQKRGLRPRYAWYRTNPVINGTLSPMRNMATIDPRLVEAELRIRPSRENRIYIPSDWGAGRDREVTKTQASDQAITEKKTKT
jgi:hypothetical protein